MRFLIDTDIIIYWLSGRYPDIHRKIESTGRNALSISAITVAELFFGAFHSTKPEANNDIVEQLIADLNVIQFDHSAARVFGNIKTKLKKAGQIIGDSDLLIAASAISDNYVLVTNNQRHFARISGLRLENWTEL